MEKKPAKILIVDDDENVLIALEHLLEGEGFSTATAWSGREALNLLRQGEFDLLLVDEQLPDLDVAELFRDVRPQAFRFLMSPATSGENRELAPGIDAAVCKWQPDDIKTKVRSYLVA